METEIENLIEACRQVVRWADAPTPKGEFPHSFLERLNRVLELAQSAKSGEHRKGEG